METTTTSQSWQVQGTCWRLAPACEWPTTTRRIM